MLSIMKRSLGHGWLAVRPAGLVGIG